MDQVRSLSSCEALTNEYVAVLTSRYVVNIPLIIVSTGRINISSQRDITAFANRQRTCGRNSDRSFRINRYNRSEGLSGGTTAGCKRHDSTVSERGLVINDSRVIGEGVGGDAREFNTISEPSVGSSTEFSVVVTSSSNHHLTTVANHFVADSDFGDNRVSMYVDRVVSRRYAVGSGLSYDDRVVICTIQ